MVTIMFGGRNDKMMDISVARNILPRRLERSPISCVFFRMYLYVMSTIKDRMKNNDMYSMILTI